MKKISRREVIRTASAFTLASAAALSFSKPLIPKNSPGKGLSPSSFRIVHITDLHLYEQRKAEMKIKYFIDSLNQLNPHPEFILNGGDNIMDSIETGYTETIRQWDIWENSFNSSMQFPIFHCIGNHDVWGIGEKSGCTGSESLFGKRMAISKLGLKERFYSFDKNNWHFIVLDSTYIEKGYYTARLDDEQFQWLIKDLESTPPTKPILILSHIPILSGCVFMDGDNEKTGNWIVPGAWMHIDARKLKDLFIKHDNIRVCLSGHTHLHDEMIYNGISYHCNGAVSGGWWQGPYQETSPGFAVIDLYSDGNFKISYQSYRWK